MIPRGFEMMLQSIIKMMGLEPAKVMSAIDGIREALQSSATDLRAIRQDQIRIMQHLGIQERTDNAVEYLGNGNSGHGTEAGSKTGVDA